MRFGIVIMNSKSFCKICLCFFQAALYANLTRVPSLLPNKRSEDQTKQAYKMLSDCFRLMLNRFP